MSDVQFLIFQCFITFYKSTNLRVSRRPVAFYFILNNNYVLIYFATCMPSTKLVSYDIVRREISESQNN